MRTDNPIADACIYYGQQEPLIYDYKCCLCEAEFDSGYGVSLEDDCFCNDCYSAGKHLAFYRELKLDADEIGQLTYKKL